MTEKSLGLISLWSLRIREELSSLGNFRAVTKWRGLVDGDFISMASFKTQSWTKRTFWKFSSLPTNCIFPKTWNCRDSHVELSKYSKTTLPKTIKKEHSQQSLWNCLHWNVFYSTSRDDKCWKISKISTPSWTVVIVSNAEEIRFWTITSKSFTPARNLKNKNISIELPCIGKNS